MKTVALILVAVGVALCASFGAKLSPSVMRGVEAQGAVSFLGEQEAEAKEAYCKARAKAGLPLDPFCGDRADEVEAGTKAEGLEARRLAARAELSQMRASRRGLPHDVAALSDRWLDLREALILPQTEVVAGAVPGPAQRLSEWQGVAGGGFLLGLFLVVAGAVWARRLESVEAPTDQTKGNAIDFGQALTDLHSQLTGLHARLHETGDDSEAKFVALRADIERVQADLVEPIVDARERLARRYGMVGYAEVFSPFSSAERRLNRAWCALVDMHPPEAEASMGIAVQQIEAARAALHALSAAKAS